MPLVHCAEQEVCTLIIESFSMCELVKNAPSKNKLFVKSFMLFRLKLFSSYLFVDETSFISFDELL